MDQNSHDASTDFISAVQATLEAILTQTLRVFFRALAAGFIVIYFVQPLPVLAGQPAADTKSETPDSARTAEGTATGKERPRKASPHALARKQQRDAEAAVASPMMKHPVQQPQKHKPNKAGSNGGLEPN